LSALALTSVRSGTWPGVHLYIVIKPTPVMQAPNQPTEALFQTCRTQHQTWAVQLAQNEEEIDQLLTLLAELPSYDYQHMRNHTVDYAQTLNQLKNRIHRLQLDVLCTSHTCVPASAKPVSSACPDGRYATPPAQGSSLVATVSSEYDRVKSRFNAFVGELMGLNLI